MAEKWPVGFSWESENGRREVKEIGPHPLRPGQIVYGVTTGGARQMALLSESELAFDIRRDASFLVRQAATARAEDDEEARERRAASWDGFTDAMTPAARARAHAALSKWMRVNGETDARGEHVRRLVAKGYRTVESKSYGRILQNPEGSGLLEKDLSKTALDYADHLVKIGRR